MADTFRELEEEFSTSMCGACGCARLLLPLLLRNNIHPLEPKEASWGYVGGKQKEHGADE